LEKEEEEEEVFSNYEITKVQPSLFQKRTQKSKKKTPFPNKKTPPSSSSHPKVSSPLISTSGQGFSLLFIDWETSSKKPFHDE